MTTALDLDGDELLALFSIRDLLPPDRRQRFVAAMLDHLQSTNCSANFAAAEVS